MRAWEKKILYFFSPSYEKPPCLDNYRGVSHDFPTEAAVKNKGNKKIEFLIWGETKKNHK